MTRSTDRARKPVWVFGPRWDLLMALSWLPVYAVAHSLDGPGSFGTTFLRHGLGFAFLLSFLHQPLTFGLIYGDSSQFRLHKRLFVVAPIVAVFVGTLAATFEWRIIIPVAAAWNLQHTLQQRYGIQRIYSGKSGYGSPRIDRAVSYVPVAAALALVAANPATLGLVKRSNLDNMNAGAVHLLVLIRPAAVALAVMGVAATGLVLLQTATQELAAGSQANPAKWLYQVSSVALLAGIVVDPAAGLIAYVSAHAIEYAVVVDRTAKKRYGMPVVGDGQRSLSLLGRVAATWYGRVGYFSAIAGVALAAHGYLPATAYNAVLYSVGGLHFTFDAVIWKLRQPRIARDFSIAGAGQILRGSLRPL